MGSSPDHFARTSLKVRTIEPVMKKLKRWAGAIRSARASGENVIRFKHKTGGVQTSIRMSWVRFISGLLIHLGSKGF